MEQNDVPKVAAILVLEINLLINFVWGLQVEDA